MSKHTELVRQLAEEMAKKSFDEQVKLGVLKIKEDWEYFQYNKYWIDTHMPFAEISVKFGAKMFEQGYEAGESDNEMINTGSYKLAEDCHQRMKAIGLIPDQPAGKDEKEVGDGA